MVSSTMASSEVQGDSQIVGDKSKKYDRQLRLWGDHGQASLEISKVCLINATATGTEILKNLILPGVGSFTIVDGKKVRPEDLGNNFFFDKDSIGKSRAQVATEFLQELNEDVSGDFLDESAESLLESNAAFFTAFSVVIATSLPERSMSRLAHILWEHDIPLLICTCYGFTGYMRLVIKEHTVIESHPDNALEDLRLDQPFQSLIDFCDSLDLDTMSSKEHSHTPWLVIIYKFLQQWKLTHNGEVPSNYREKNAFKETIRNGIRKNSEGTPELEENFDEAIANVNTSLVHSKIPSEVQQIFDDESCSNLHSESRPFWILARAVKEFVQNEGKGLLPLRGSIPDMTADSGRYIQLQTIYKDQSAHDVSTVASHLYSLLQNIGREDLLNVEYRSQSSPPRKSQDGITEHDIKAFCKNASFLRVIRTRSLQDEYNPSKSKIGELAYHLEDEDSDLVHYVMLRAVNRFYTSFNRYPGYYTHSLEDDVPKLKNCVAKLLNEWNLSSTVKDDYILEYCRYGASEMHSIAAYMGGAAAHEVIKLLTSQFLPINNTHIYNAAKQTSMTVQL